ncbi:hypothetical protein [Lachnospira multipara]|uniref:hypothetical protein n=1 Tax=Lachnospira multipara TaxID=28051 RepID=UPI000486C6F6|nr:hypothetical protein [Lachnospira multipara]
MDLFSMSNVLLDVDFYNSEAYAGDSFLPFIGFMLFLIGIVALFIGAVKIIAAKRDFHIFFDKRNEIEMSKLKSQKNIKTGIVLVVLGAICTIISFFIL